MSSDKAGSRSRDSGGGEDNPQRGGSASRRYGEDVETAGNASNHSAGSSKRDTASAKSIRRQQSDPNAPARLLLVSSKIKNSSVMNAAVLSNVIYMQYKYESASLDSLAGKEIYLN